MNNLTVSGKQKFGKTQAFKRVASLMVRACSCPPKTMLLRGNNGVIRGSQYNDLADGLVLNNCR